VKKRAAAGRAQGTAQISIAQHPRARRHVQVAKGWAGLAGCALAGYASWHGGAPFFDTVLRALLWGIAAYVVMWFLAVQVWRQLAVAEVRAAEKQWLERKREAERVQRERAAQIQAEQAMAGGSGG
jgi:uncharacterized membrane protein